MTPPLTMPLDTIRTHVRQYVESFMDAQVIVRRGGRGAMDPVTGVVSGMAGAIEVYNGKARLHLAANQGNISLGPGEINQQAVTVTIPWDAPPPQKDDVVEIVDAGADQTLNGDAFLVTGTDGAGLFLDARRMQCVVWQPSEYWTGTGSGYTP